MAVIPVKQITEQGPRISGETSAEKFIARQPIFDSREKVYGYELLFRSGIKNYFDGSDPNRATYSVIVDSLLLHGLERLTGRRKAFINYPREALLNGYAEVIPNNLAVVEILETVEPDAEVLAACRHLKDLGYCLVLDDVFSSERPEAFQGLVDIIKVDLSLSTPVQREQIVRRFAPRGIALLGEKVETHEEFQQLKTLGFQYFQGYFFSKPQIISSRDIPAFKLNYLRILQAINRPEINLEEIERIIKGEPSLCYKLLRYLNSSFFGLRSDIRSIRHAVFLLGEREVRLWVSLLVLTSMGEDKPQELVVTSLVRASWCESLAGKIGMRGREGDLFLLGLFSMIDAILDRPLPEILAQLPVPEDTRTALLHRNTRLAQVLALVEAYEQGDWEKLTGLAASLQIDEASIPEMYLTAVEWARQVFQLA
ncbi:MAG: HDOD domain-containing protein [Acidobacteria bacterium]|nr:HDOD domain-containing protein [Acidobacteriota bacterium]